MTDRRGTREHRDAIWKAFGSPTIAPSMIEAVEREFEALEAVRWDAGVKWAREHPEPVDHEAVLGAVLDELEDRCGHPVFDRTKWEAALMAVEKSGRRGDLQPKPLFDLTAPPVKRDYDIETMREALRHVLRNHEGVNARGACEGCREAKELLYRTEPTIGGVGHEAQPDFLTKAPPGSVPDWHCGSGGCGAKSSAENPCPASPAFARKFLRAPLPASVAHPIPTPSEGDTMDGDKA